MNIKKTTVMLLSSVLLFSVTGCNRGDNNQGGNGSVDSGPLKEPSKDPIFVSVVDAGLGHKWMDDLAKAYMEETGITVNVSYDPDLPSSVETKMGSMKSEKDDLYFVNQAGKSWMTYTAKNMMVPLDDVLRSDRYGEAAINRTRDDVALTMGKYIDERTMTVPYIYTCWGLVYNQNYLDKIESYGKYQKGVFPETVEGLLDLCTAVNNAKIVNVRTKKTVMPYSAGLNVHYMDYMFISLWYQNDPDGMKAYYNQNDPAGFNSEHLNTPGFKKAMETMYDIVGAKSKSENNMVSSSQDHLESQASFVNGDCVFTVTGSWFANEMHDIMNEVGLTEYHFAAFPRYEEEGKTPIQINYPGENFFIPSGAENIDGAKDFLAFCLSEEGVAICQKAINSPTLFTSKENVEMNRFGQEVENLLDGSDKIYTYSENMVYKTDALGLFKMNINPFYLMATLDVSSKDQIQSKIIDAEIAAHKSIWKEHMALLPRK